MSAASRLFSGSMAGWASILVAVCTQIALVPIFLHHWSVEEFGSWIAIQAMFAFATALSSGFQTYVEFEFLKIGEKNKSGLSRLLSNSIPLVIMVAALEVIAVFFITKTSYFPSLLSLDSVRNNELIKQASGVLLLQLITWCLFTATTGLIQRSIVPFGFYPRNAWWYLIGTIINTGTTILAVVNGANILETSFFVFSSSFFYYLILNINLYKIVNKCGLSLVRPCLSDGFSYWLMSTVVGIRNVLNLIQQQGIRVLLAGVVGVKEMAAFSTMRTVSNIGLQAVGTISNPITPELMRFIHLRDKENVSNILAVFWFFSVAILGVGLVVLQLFAPFLFKFWTLGKINYDPIVFSLLSMGLLIYGLSQPLFSIVKGNNLQKIQLITSIICSLITIGLVVWIGPVLNIRAAAVAIFICEVVSFLSFSYAARKWMIENKFEWPNILFNFWSFYSLVSVIGLFLMSLFMCELLISFITLSFQLGLLVVFYMKIPLGIKTKMNTHLKIWFGRGRNELS